MADKGEGQDGGMRRWRLILCIVTASHTGLAVLDILLIVIVKSESIHPAGSRRARRYLDWLMVGRGYYLSGQVAMP